MTSITRRSLTLGLGASAALAAASPPIVADAAGQRAVLPSVASRKIGAVQVRAVSDGFIDVPFDVFSGAPVSEIETAFAARFSRPSTGMHRLGFTSDNGGRVSPHACLYANPVGITTAGAFQSGIPGNRRERDWSLSHRRLKLADDENSLGQIKVFRESKLGRMVYPARPSGR